MIAPKLPRFDRAAIVDHAMDSTGLKTASPQAAAWAALVAYARHTYTDYDDLLAEGYEFDAARHFALDATNQILAEWGCRKEISGDETDG